MLTPKTPVKSAEDPISLATRPEPTADLYLSVARLFEQSGKLDEAQQQYRKALEVSPDDLSALLSYARLKDRVGEAGEALKLYRRAAESHPKVAAVHNNMALFYARRGMLDQSTAALREAIRLEPRNPKYRNNIATVLVEMGRPEEALTQLRAVEAEAVANYNLGYLLEKKGQVPSAMQHFALALSMDPSMVPAREGLRRLADVSTRRSAANLTAARPQNQPPPTDEPRLENREPMPTPQPGPIAAGPPRQEVVLPNPKIANPRGTTPSVNPGHADMSRPHEIPIASPPGTTSSPYGNLPNRSLSHPRATAVRQLPPPPKPSGSAFPKPHSQRGWPGPALSPEASLPRRLPPTSRNLPAWSLSAPPAPLERQPLVKQPAASPAPLPPKSEHIPLQHLPPVNR